MYCIVFEHLYSASHSRERSAHLKTWSAHKYSFQNCFARNYFKHVVPNTDEYWYSLAQKKFSAHTDFEKLEGTLHDCMYVCLYSNLHVYAWTTYVDYPLMLDLSNKISD